MGAKQQIRGAEIDIPLWLLTPLTLGLVALIAGVVLDAMGLDTEAGLAGATAVFILAISLFVYGVIWGLGKFD